MRLLGVNTPELWERDGKKWHRLANPDPRAIAAYEYLRSLEGQRVQVQYDKEKRDRYGRTLAHLCLIPAGPDLAGELLRRGWGELCAIPPNTTRYAEWKADHALATTTRYPLHKLLNKTLFWVAFRRQASLGLVAVNSFPDNVLNVLRLKSSPCD